MTINELFDYTDEQFPNQYSSPLKMEWINTLEKEIFDYLGMFDDEIEFTKHTSVTETLQIDEPDIYALYIAARADFANGEYARYNNKVAQFNAFFDDWKSKYLRHHQPLGKRYIRI